MVWEFFLFRGLPLNITEVSIKQNWRIILRIIFSRRNKVILNLIRFPFVQALRINIFLSNTRYNNSCRLSPFFGHFVKPFLGIILSMDNALLDFTRMKVLEFEGYMGLLLMPFQTPTPSLFIVSQKIILA